MPKRRVNRHSVAQPSDPSYRIIPLTRGYNALVDMADYHWLNQWNWCALITDDGIYAVRRQDRKFIYMHRFIIGCSSRDEADHWNHDTLDNRRLNLRKCTSAQNKWNQRLTSINTSGFKGVSWDKTRQKWSAKISLNDRTINLGRFQLPEGAAKAYDQKAREMFGEFAHTNFPIASE